MSRIHLYGSRQVWNSVERQLAGAVLQVTDHIRVHETSLMGDLLLGLAVADQLNLTSEKDRGRGVGVGVLHVASLANR